MSRKKQGTRSLKQFWMTWRGWLLLALFLLVILTGLVVLAWMGMIETGFGQFSSDPSTAPAPERAKTLWDWMDLLLVLLVLSIGAALLTWSTNKREREVELDRSREAVLQTYLDRTTALLRSQWRESGNSFVEANIIRAQALTVLRQLDGERKALLLQFLYESGLIKMWVEPEPYNALVNLHKAELDGANLHRADLRRANLGWVSLFHANLSRANLGEVYLRGADLGGADLGGADLHRADLSLADLSGANLAEANVHGVSLLYANLRGADLHRADLGEADLYEADLYEADLRGANLRGANMGGADLRDANLSRANLAEAKLRDANLGEAYLSGAKVTDEQLAQAESLEGATMPDATKYAGDPPTRGRQTAESQPTQSELENDSAGEYPDHLGTDDPDGEVIE
jgi:uncharacterized protein YjbI with pentapeptide repeats